MITKLPRKDIYNNYFMLEFKLSDVVIPFRELLGYIGTKDIYSGNESIPFQEKDKEFQSLLLSEFKT